MRSPERCTHLPGRSWCTTWKGEEPGAPLYGAFKYFWEADKHNEIACSLLRSLVKDGKEEGELGDPFPSSSAIETARRLGVSGRSQGRTLAEDGVSRLTSVKELRAERTREPGQSTSKW